MILSCQGPSEDEIRNFQFSKCSCTACKEPEAGSEWMRPSQHCTVKEPAPRLAAAGGARVSVASRWALRSGSCRLGCALVGAASYTNGLGMALLSPSMCRSSRECRGRCLMGMDRYAILLIYRQCALAGSVRT